MAYIKEEDEWTEYISNSIEAIYRDKLDEPEISKILLSHGQEEDIDIVFIKIIRNFAADKDKICYLAKKLNNLSDAETLLYKCLPIKRKNDYPIIASFILQCLQVDLTVTQISNILYTTREWHETTGIYVQDAVDYLLNIKGAKDFAPIPKWVSVKEGENLSLLKNILPGDGAEANRERNTNFIAQAHDLFHEIKGQKVKGQGININLEEAMQAVLSAYSEGENPEQTSADRVFGPLNRMSDRDCISNPYGNGPCRMLECICCEFDDVSYEGEKIEAVYSNWFTGRCNVCMRSIRDSSHTVRLPLENGGWNGCYCSIDCIRGDNTIRINEKVNILLNNMMFTLDDAGIMDRSKV